MSRTCGRRHFYGPLPPSGARLIRRDVQESPLEERQTMTPKILRMLTIDADGHVLEPRDTWEL